MMTKPDGELPLASIKSVYATTVRGAEYSFEVHFGGNPQKGHVKSPWILKTSSNEERKQWMEAIKPGSSANLYKKPSSKILCSQPSTRANSYTSVNVGQAISNSHASSKLQHVSPVHAYMPSADSFQIPRENASSVASFCGIEHPQQYPRSHSDNSMKSRAWAHSTRSHSLQGTSSLKLPTVTDAEIDSLIQCYLACELDGALEFPLLSPLESSRSRTLAIGSSQVIKSKQQPPYSSPEVKLECLSNGQSVASIPGDPSLAIAEKSVISESSQVQISWDALPSPKGGKNDDIDGANAKEKLMAASSIVTHTSLWGNYDLDSIPGKAPIRARDLEKLPDDDGEDSPLSDLAIIPLDISRASLMHIGEGRFGDVYSAKLKHGVAPIQVAVKTAKKSSSSKEKVEFMREMTIMSQMMHPNIVRLYGVVQQGSEQPWIVLEYLENGNLSEFLMKNERPVKQLIKYMIDISMGMHHLVEKGLIHTNLAAHNILVGGDETCKVADSGFLLEAPKGDSINTKRADVSYRVRWMPPESISQHKFSSASDVWSFGILLWEMFNPGIIPYKRLDDEQVIKFVLEHHTMPLPRNIPSFVAKMIRGCWQYNPESRPNFKRISKFLPSNYTPEPQVDKSADSVPGQLSSEAEKKARVPFLKSVFLECDSSGKEHTFKDHKVTFRIPKGTIAKGNKVKFEIGVTICGPFNFPEDTQPISPIVWLNMVEGNCATRITFQIIFPHFLTRLSLEELHYHQIELSSADCDNCSYQMNYGYAFIHCDTQPHFSANGILSCEGLTLTRHGCFYCILAKETHELIRDADYYLARIEKYLLPGRSEVYFVATYCLKTCIEALKEQFPVEDGYNIINQFRRFKFSSEKGTELQLKILCSCERELYDIALDPNAAEIKASDIKLGFDAIYDDNSYPPRVKMTIMLKKPRNQFKLPIKFVGCTKSSLLDIDLALPLTGSINSYYNIIDSDSETLPTTLNQSQFMKALDRPELRVAYNMLLGIASDWKIIGGLLGVEGLDNIKRDEEGVRQRLRAMLEKWLKQVDPKPTWQELVDAVENVDATRAQEIRKLHM